MVILMQLIGGMLLISLVVKGAMAVIERQMKLNEIEAEKESKDE
jgi:hypothetical protein